MSDYPKYRLKKDTPNYDAGSIFIVRTDDIDTISLNGKDDIEDIHGNFYSKVADIKHFDEWFEEVKEEPKWVRKQIKRVNFDKNKQYAEVDFRFVKTFHFFADDECFGGMIKYWRKGTDRSIRFNKVDIASNIRDDIDGLNQLVRDGYIEIEDNPNIVWENEKCD